MACEWTQLLCLCILVILLTLNKQTLIAINPNLSLSVIIGVARPTLLIIAIITLLLRIAPTLILLLRITLLVVLVVPTVSPLSSLVASCLWRGVLWWLVWRWRTARSRVWRILLIVWPSATTSLIVILVGIVIAATAAILLDVRRWHTLMRWLLMVCMWLLVVRLLGMFVASTAVTTCSWLLFALLVAAIIRTKK